MLAGAGLVLAVMAAYYHSLAVPFQFDDQPAVAYNPTIRDLTRLGDVLHPPADAAGATGRPLVNLSFAVNYAWGGLDVRGYHALNLALHALAVLVLWGVLRRTFRQAAVPARVRLHAEGMARAVALLWAVHPLVSESVVCVVQRNEVMGALFYLLTLYGFVRATTPGAAIRRWKTVAVGACLLGIASKETVATAPLLVLLYDRTFVAGSFKEAWRQRRGFHLSLMATWLGLGWLMGGTGQRAGTVGFGLGVSPWSYLLTQCEALTLYLKLSLWPHPLVVDYGTAVVRGVGDVWAQGGLVLTLLGATLWALCRRPVWGFVGAWFFAILAPSSSFVPLTTQTMAEHRMYLPLVAVLVLVVAAMQRLAGRRVLAVAAMVALGLAWLTAGRVRTYQSERTLWTDTVDRVPGNQRAHLNLGQVLFRSGDLAGAAGQFERALRIQPDYAEALYNLGLTEAQLGHTGQAISRFEAALAVDPGYALVRNDLGIALAETGQTAAAQDQFEAALRVRSDLAGANYNLANLLLRSGRPAAAIPHFVAALARHDDVADYHANLALALMQTGRRAEALTHWAAAVRLAPALPDLRLNYALALAATGKLSAAVTQLQAALRLRPDFPAAKRYLTEMESDLKRIGPGQPP